MDKNKSYDWAIYKIVNPKGRIYKNKKGLVFNYTNAN